MSQPLGSPPPQISSLAATSPLNHRTASAPVQKSGVLKTSNKTLLESQLPSQGNKQETIKKLKEIGQAWREAFEGNEDFDLVEKFIKKDPGIRYWPNEGIQNVKKMAQDYQLTLAFLASIEKIEKKEPVRNEDVEAMKLFTDKLIEKTYKAEIQADIEFLTSSPFQANTIST